MGDDFFRVLRNVDQIVHQDRLDGVTQREELDRLLSGLSLAARKLADELRSYPPAENPGILYDGCEGEWEERAWVPVAMAASPRAAKRAIPAVAREMACDEPGFHLVCSSRGWLAPSEYVHGDEDWRYVPCRAGDEGAVEFWIVEITERRVSLRRGVSNAPRAARLYRHKRSKGDGRWKSATRSIRLYFTPQWVRSLQRSLTAITGGKDQ